jgi:ATP-dependent protease ClpP protease subunit
MAEAKVYISGPIVADSSEAGNAYPYTTLEDVVMQLDWQRPFENLRVVINSPGGRVDKGLGIYDYLRALGGVTITTEAIGQCSSIANAVFLAGDVRLAHQHVESLVHLPSGGVIGATAAEAQQFADEMAQCEQRLIALYVERAGVEATAITELMSNETVLTAEQLLSNGIATQLVQPATALATLPKTATTSSDDDQAPSWVQSLMSKFNLGLTAMNAALANLSKKPATAQAVDAPAITALDVTTEGGATLAIATGERTTYEVGDAVTDNAGAAVADADYVLTDGNTIAVTGGAISAITPAEEETSSTASADVDAAIPQIASAITAVANRLGRLEATMAAQAKVVNRVAATAGSNAVPARASAANDEGKDADIDPIKAAGEARKARRDAKFKKA